MKSEVDDFNAFMKRREEASQAYINGDADPLNDESTHTSPATIFGPKGDYVEGAAEVNARNQHDAISFEEGGKTHFEIMHLSADATLAYWAGIQRSTIKLKGKPEAAPMDLRVTEVFRREAGGWKLIHRHADPLVAESEKAKK